LSALAMVDTLAVRHQCNLNRAAKPFAIFLRRFVPPKKGKGKE
jgi:hypothetical protein